MNDLFLRPDIFKKTKTIQLKSVDDLPMLRSSQDSLKKPAGLLSKKRWKKLKTHYIPKGTNIKQIISSEEDGEDLSKREIEIISHYDEPQGEP